MLEVWGSITGLVIADTVSAMARPSPMFLRSCVAQALTNGNGPATPYKLLHISTSIRKICFFNFSYAAAQAIRNRTKSWFRQMKTWVRNLAGSHKIFCILFASLLPDAVEMRLVFCITYENV